MPSTTEPPRPAAFRPPPLLIGLGILVVALGFGLPRLFTSSAPDAAASEPEAADQKSGSIASSMAEAPQSIPHLWMSLGRMAVGLVIVCGLCIAITRWMAGQKPAATGKLEVLASLAIDPRCAIHLVRAGERRLLIGTDFAGVKALVEMPGPLPETGAVDAAAASAAAGVVIGPASMPAPAAPPAPTPAAATADELLALLGRLRGVAAKTSPGA